MYVGKGGAGERVLVKNGVVLRLSMFMMCTCMEQA